MMVTTQFESGNIETVKSKIPDLVRLKIRQDLRGKLSQWFYFRVHDVKGQELTYQIDNAGKSSFPRGWNDYRVFGSHDRQKWFRLQTDYDQHRLRWKYNSPADSIYFAYYIPYSYERQLDFIGKILRDSRFVLNPVCFSVHGRPIDLLSIGNPDGKKLWFIARQHPGESMASWFMEGLLDALAASDTNRPLLQQAQLLLVPNMNPDGTVVGNIRVNAAGIDLNRAWKKPKRQKSPEVYGLRKHMKQTGVDFFLDVHGDEAIPYNFIACCEGIPSYSEKQEKLEQRFRADWEAANNDFQSLYGYKIDAPGKANLKIASNYVGEKFGCLSATLEMPFKDNALRKRKLDNPLPSIRKLAVSCLNVVEQMIPEL